MAKREYKLISADSHLSLPPQFFRRHLPKQHQDHQWVQMVEDMTKQMLKMAGMGLAHMAGRPYEKYKEKDISEDEIRPGAYDPEARLADMDLDAVDAEVLISGGAAPEGEGMGIDTDFQRAVIQSYNNFLSEFCSTAPDRLIGPATIPFQVPELGLEEMKRAAKLPGIRAFLFEAFPPVPFWDEMYEPFWQVANDLGYPIHLHIGLPRSTSFTMESLAPNKQGTAMSFISLSPPGLMETLAILIFSGVIERHPNINFIFTEAGVSWLAYFKERLDIVFTKHRFWTQSPLTEMPSTIIDRQVINTFIEDTTAIRIRHEVGIKNMMWSTDYPHSDSTWPHSWKYVESAFADVPEDERHQIMAGNAIEVYGL
jgi:predicted TIM-barrel fold metal-dependent hydrolase